MSEFKIRDNIYNIETREELKEIVFREYDEDFLRNCSICELDNMPKCTLRNNLVEYILQSSDCDIKSRKKIEDYLEYEASRYSITASFKIFTAYACVCHLFNARQNNDLILLDKACLALCIITNIGMSVI